MKGGRRQEVEREKVGNKNGEPATQLSRLITLNTMNTLDQLDHIDPDFTDPMPAVDPISY